MYYQYLDCVESCVIGEEYQFVRVLVSYRLQQGAALAKYQLEHHHISSQPQSDIRHSNLFTNALWLNELLPCTVYM